MGAGGPGCLGSRWALGLALGAGVRAAVGKRQVAFLAISLLMGLMALLRPGCFDQNVECDTFHFARTACGQGTI